MGELLTMGYGRLNRESRSWWRGRVEGAGCLYRQREATVRPKEVTSQQLSWVSERIYVP
jgi:hypothetical protein